jgi:hypothetical protein
MTGCNEIHQTGKPTYENFVSSHSFPYIASQERQTQIIKNYSKLTVGLTEADIIALLGEPDCADPLYTKAPPPNMEYLGFRWTYFIEKPDPNLSNLKKDITVEVYFDTNSKTDWIVSNVDGLYEIGRPY